MAVGGTGNIYNGNNLSDACRVLATASNIRGCVHATASNIVGHVHNDFDNGNWIRF